MTAKLWHRIHLCIICTLYACLKSIYVLLLVCQYVHSKSSQVVRRKIVCHVTLACKLLHVYIFTLGKLNLCLPSRNV